MINAISAWCFPRPRSARDPVAIRDYAQAAEGLGYTHLLAYDHVLGADPTDRPGWRGYTRRDLFHEPFVLFGYLAGLTAAPRTRHRRHHPAAAPDGAGRQAGGRGGRAERRAAAAGRRRRLEPGRVRGAGRGLPQPRQAQSRSRSRCCAGCSDRGVGDLRRAWHQVTAAGLNPLPVQRPHPDLDRRQRRRGAAARRRGWATAGSRRCARSRRAGRRSSGCARWPRRPGATRRPSASRRGVSCKATTWTSWWPTRAWRDIGATHLGVNTMGAGLADPTDHIAAITQIKQVLDEL